MAKYKKKQKVVQDIPQAQQTWPGVDLTAKTATVEAPRRKIVLKHKDYCDNCSEIEQLGTLAGHKRCKIYGAVMLPRPDLEITSRGQGSMLRFAKCKEENDFEIKRVI